jgi:hypothetical protein
MEFCLETTFFQSASQWHAWRLGLDLSEYKEITPPGISPEQAGELQARHRALHRYFKDLLTDLFENPQAYGLPDQPFEPFIESRLRLQEDKVRKERVMATRLKARKALETGILDFLYQVGQAAEPGDEILTLDRTFYEKLLGEKVKKSGIKPFGKGYERLGLHFSDGDPVAVSNTQYPGMLPALAAFAKACAGIKDFGYFFFRRCDLGVLGGKRQPTLEDALRLAPPVLRDEMRKTDTLLAERKYKREILVGDANAGYRLRYNQKNDRVVYWCRFMSWFSPPFHHNLRWEFKSDVTPRLFNRLDEVRPGLADRVFEGNKKCEYDYENCMARVVLERHGISQDFCTEAGWDMIGETPSELNDLRQVLGVLDELL